MVKCYAGNSGLEQRVGILGERDCRATSRGKKERKKELNAKAQKTQREEGVGPDSCPGTATQVRIEHRVYATGGRTIKWWRFDRVEVREV